MGWPKRKVLTPEEKKRRMKRRLLIYGLFFATLYGLYKFQPIEIEIFPADAPAYKALDPDSKRLFSKGTRVLVITAHPDDSEFYAGGLLPLLRDSGAEIAHLLHTDGDKAYYFWADHSDLRKIRRDEQMRASKQWGAKQIWFLGYPDGRLRDTDQTVKDSAKYIQEFKPDYVLTFDGLYPNPRRHQDHRVTGEIAAKAMKMANFKGWALLFSSRAPNFVVDIEKVWAEKQALLAIHKSQFYGKRLEFIQNHRTDAAVADGELAGVTFGEAYRAVQY